ncbi:MAG: GNAT family N-acetyltransferase [Methylocystis sp.]|uniref:GNAT family N-acetyltransferase n=1 Tax=Methylocystis sp. TaxID=1911079 RepID=UPI003DA36766
MPETPAFQTGELGLEQMEAARGDWARLASGALEPNAFFSPGFLLAAARHFPPPERPRFIGVRDPGGALVGLFPLAAPGPSGTDGFLRLWRHELSALATPLVDRARPAETIAAFLDWVEAGRASAGVLFPRLPVAGAFHAALREATQGRRQLAVIETYARAALLPGASAVEKMAQAGGRKRLNELGRMRRRLGEMGALAVDVAAAPMAVRAAAEEFLALEASGWKAGRGALLFDAALATFLRSATRMLAEEGLCRIVALRLDGRAIAMMIAIESQNRSYCWKIAYDEGYRAQAPGIQLIGALTGLQLARPEIELTDSCAIANHPMIDRLWPDRIGVCDLAASARRSPDGAFRRACGQETLRRGLRGAAKAAAYRLLGRTPR